MVSNTELPKYLKIDYDVNICDCIVHDDFIIETALKISLTWFLPKFSEL